jgi:hypothetical protein
MDQSSIKQRYYVSTTRVSGWVKKASWIHPLTLMVLTSPRTVRKLWNAHHRDPFRALSGKPKLN